MKQSLLGITFALALTSAPSMANDVLMYEDFYNYDTGFYDTRAVLYDTDNDWYYDYYVLGPQEEVDYTYDAWENEYEWEVEEDIW